MSRLVEQLTAMHAGAGKGHSRPQGSVVKFPPRSELAFLNETIPLFYIGQNRDGFWIARDADGRSGGVFFFKASAVRFARTKPAPAGCALMFTNEPFELDYTNEGSQVVEIFTAAIAVARRRVPTLSVSSRWGCRMAEAFGAAVSRRCWRTASPCGHRARSVPRSLPAGLEDR
jgi:hypothetical protein